MDSNDLGRSVPDGPSSDDGAASVSALRAFVPSAARLLAALNRLEAANNALCAKRSDATYNSMIFGDGAQAELEALDEARRLARALIHQTDAGGPIAASKRLIELASENGDFVTGDDGFVMFWPNGMSGALTEWMLCALATELERRNAPWQQQLDQHVEASAIETRSAETAGLSPKGESAAPKEDARG